MLRRFMPCPMESGTLEFLEKKKGETPSKKEIKREEGKKENGGGGPTAISARGPGARGCALTHSAAGRAADERIGCWNKCCFFIEAPY